jgi:hypothetical protein
VNAFDEREEALENEIHAEIVDSEKEYMRMVVDILVLRLIAESLQDGIEVLHINCAILQNSEPRHPFLASRRWRFGLLERKKMPSGSHTSREGWRSIKGRFTYLG